MSSSIYWFIIIIVTLVLITILVLGRPCRRGLPPLLPLAHEAFASSWFLLFSQVSEFLPLPQSWCPVSLRASLLCPQQELFSLGRSSFLSLLGFCPSISPFFSVFKRVCSFFLALASPSLDLVNSSMTFLSFFCLLICLLESGPSPSGMEWPSPLVSLP